jgi:DNA repair exonuclease SbcCD ATPase subunit
MGPALAICIIGWIRSEQGRKAAVDRVTQLEQAVAKAGFSAPPAPTPDAEVHLLPAPGNTGSQQPHGGPAKPPASAPHEGSAADARTIEELHQRVQELTRDLTAAREDVAKAESKSSADAAELKKLQAQIDEVRDGAQTLKRSLEAVEAELKVKSERLTKAEADEKRATDRAARAEAAAARSAALTKDTEDMLRRREVLVTSLMRRYRDVTDLYRNFTLNAQTRETPGAGLQAGDLSRIQSAIQQAEEDLRQLNSLNARLAQALRARQ